jgi:hypothetical protein
VSFSFNSAAHTGFINMGFVARGFPSNEEIRQEAAKGHSLPVEELVVVSIHEFAGRRDYMTFWGARGGAPPAK